MKFAIKTKRPLPEEYLELILCRMYSCTPSELDEQDYERMLMHLACLEGEIKAHG